MLALCTGVLLFVSSCASPPPPPEAPATEPSGLAEFYAQEIEFGPCAPYASSSVDEQSFAREQFDCARVEVPLNYADPDGPRGKIAMLRAKARGEKIGSLLVNPGGPGGSGMSFVGLLRSVSDFGRVGERFDVIGFDPRGVGASTPRVECYTDAETDQGKEPAPYLFDVPDDDTARDVAQRCIQGTGGVDALTSVGSSNMVRDMDLMREVLGDEKLTYLGYSYGSELGGMYAEAFPENLRAMVIDGAVDPLKTESEFRLSQFAAWQNAFTELAEGCASEPNCPLGTDPGQANERFHNLVRPLQDNPLPVAGSRSLSYDAAVQAVSTSLFVKAQWPIIIQGLSELAAGRGEVLLGLRDDAMGRGPDGRYGGGLNVDANLAIRCMDNPRRTADEHTELSRRAWQAAPFLDPGGPVQRAHYECEAWPSPVSRSLPWFTGNVELPPTLTVSVTGDPGTPHEGGVNLARRLGGSLLTVEGAQHGVAMFGQSECVDRAVADYLVDLQTPSIDARCTL